MATKRSSPMKMRETKSDKPVKVDKHKGDKPSAMERYASQRKETMKMAAVPAMVEDLHDPVHDLHYLERAHEIRQTPGRHKAAKAVAVKKMQALKEVVK